MVVWSVLVRARYLTYTTHVNIKFITLNLSCLCVWWCVCLSRAQTNTPTPERALGAKLDQLGTKMWADDDDDDDDDGDDDGDDGR